MQLFFDSLLESREYPSGKLSRTRRRVIYAAGRIVSLGSSGRSYSCISLLLWNLCRFSLEFIVDVRLNVTRPDIVMSGAKNCNWHRHFILCSHLHTAPSDLLRCGYIFVNSFWLRKWAHIPDQLNPLLQLTDWQMKRRIAGRDAIHANFYMYWWRSTEKL